MRNTPEYLVNGQYAWVKSLEEEEKEPIDQESNTIGEIVLDGYHIDFNKKVTLMPADLTSVDLHR